MGKIEESLPHNQLKSLSLSGKISLVVFVVLEIFFTIRLFSSEENRRIIRRYYWWACTYLFVTD